ncbi:MAG: hypothetical protein RDV48_04590 [Candidatus Eremiobacteraeota bacterium]|nr:hypothetical protein [Candidatus Eremiobacteraeota bacterium]
MAGGNRKEKLMAKRCPVCDHTESEAINKALINNTPLHTITHLYTLALDSLKWHKRKHLPELLSKAEEAKAASALAMAEVVQEKEAMETGQADSLMGQLKEIISRTERIYGKAEEAGDLRTALQAIKESRENLTLLGKLIGQIQDGLTINLYNHPVWIDLRAVILTALEPYPEAKEALSDALSRACK